jgi:hypothetical protein
MPPATPPRALQDAASALGMPATLSSNVGATLLVLDISGCVMLRSIDVVLSCVQLRCLWMPGCVSVLDLSPLGGCSETLEELWMAGNGRVRSLAPLKVCTKLRKLDLRGCRSALLNQVEGLQVACSQLAAPSSVELEGLVHELQPSIPPGMQARAARVLAKLLGPELAADVRGEAARALGDWLSQS